MKIRNGFVSNSSSSSFIVALKKGAKAEATVTINIDFSNYGERIETIEQLKDYIDCHYGSVSEVLDLFMKMEKAINDGKVIIAGSFSDEDDPQERLLCNLGLEGHVNTDEVQIIQNEAGY